MNRRRGAIARLGLLAAVLAAPLAHAAIIELASKQAYPESLSATADGTLYIGSAGAGGVLRVAPGALKAEQWIAPGAFSSRSILGVFVDAHRGVLWVCSDDLASAKIVSPGAGPTSLKGFDLKSGAGKVSVTLPGNDPFCNDIAIAADGAVYVSESTNGRVLKLSPDMQGLAVWAADKQLLDIDGIAFGADGNLYANTYAGNGLFRIAVHGATAAGIVRLTTPRALFHPDGMRTEDGNTFLMVEGSGKLDRIGVRGDTVELVTLSDSLAEPAAVTRIGPTVWVAETQISALFDDQHVLVPKLPFRIVGVPAAGH
jgi:sugar lactone lactonase YvrE